MAATVATLDIEVQAEKNILVQQGSYADVKQYYEAWDKVYIATTLADGAVGLYQIGKNWEGLYNGASNFKGSLKTAYETIKDFSKWGKVEEIVGNIPSNFFENVNDLGDTYDQFQKLSSTIRGEIYNYYKQQKWDKIEAIFAENKINGGWPPAQGGYNIIDDVPLIKGMKFDRYGDAIRGWNGNDLPPLGGEFTSPLNKSSYDFGQRALNKTESQYDFYYEIEIIKDLPFKGESADVIPWFNQVGKGKQMRWKIPIDPATGYPKTWNKLAQEGYIKIIIKDSPSNKYKNIVNKIIQ